MRQRLRQHRSRARASFGRLSVTSTTRAETATERDAVKTRVGKIHTSDYIVLLAIGTIVPCQIGAYFTALNCCGHEAERVPLQGLAGRLPVTHRRTTDDTGLSQQRE